MFSRQSIFYKIVTRKYDFCCLCFKTIEVKQIQFQDEVVLNNDEPDNTVKVFEILSYVFGEEAYNTMSGFNIMCKQCARWAVNSYKFIKMAKENMEFLKKSINNLDTCLEASGDNYQDIKTMFINYDPVESSCQKYLSKTLNKTSSSALETFNTIISTNTDFRFEVKLEYNVIDENEMESTTLKKKKRKPYSFTGAIKTSDMLHNKNEPNIMQCKECLKVYSSLPNLRNHFIRIHAPKKYKCTICCRKFGSLSILETHKNDYHCCLVCKECGKTFHNRQTLKMHEISHYLKLVCQDCGRTYKSQSTFKKHLELNICGQKSRASPANAKFTCDYCNKKYTQKVTLRVHIQYEHGNYKSLECKWCKKKFWAQSRLKAHIVKHTQEKKFSCTICGGKFVTKESLLYHTRTHTGEKPYKCEFCDVRFLSASRRADHTKRHHSNSTFQCKLCHIKYTTQLCLQQHMKSHENLKKNDYFPLSGVEQGNMRLSEDDAFFLSEEEDYCMSQD